MGSQLNSKSIRGTCEELRHVRWETLPINREDSSVHASSGRTNCHHGKSILRNTSYQSIKDRYWCPLMQPEIAHFGRGCDPCQKMNPPEKSSPFGRIPVSCLLHIQSIDLAGPLKETEDGNKYLLLAVEHTS